MKRAPIQTWFHRSSRSLIDSRRHRRRETRPLMEALEARQLMTLIPLKGPDGTTAPPVEIFQGTDNTYSTPESIGEADNGNYAVAWMNGAFGDVYTQLYSHDGTALTPQVSPGRSDESYYFVDQNKLDVPTASVKLAMNHQGDYVVAWTNVYSRFGKSDVQILARYTTPMELRMGEFATLLPRTTSNTSPRSGSTPLATLWSPTPTGTAVRRTSTPRSAEPTEVRPRSP